MRPSLYSSLPLLFLASALSPAGARQGGDLPAGKTILDALEKKIGSAEARAKLRILAIRGTTEFPGMPEGMGEMGKCTFEEIFVGSDKAMLTSTMEGMGTFSQGRDGSMAWSTDPAMGVTIREGEEAGPVLRWFGILRREAWTALYEKAECVGRKKLGERECYELRMSPKKGKPDTWLVDCETHLLLALDTAFPDPMGGVLPMQFQFSDYKPVAGVLFPHLRKQVVGEYVIAYAYQSIEPDAAGAAERFALPREVTEALKDPKRRSKAAPEKGGECALETVEAQPVASIRVTIDAKEVSKSLAVLLPEVMAHVAKAKAPMAGPPFSRYHEMKDGQIDLEAGIPLKKAVAGEGRVKASELPAGRAAVTWHFGPYHELPRTYAVLEGWLESQKLEPSGGFWEVYWTDPGIEPDPAKWRTQIFWPVK